jgi:hypothetical protein
MVHLYKAILKERMNPAAASTAAQLETLKEETLASAILLGGRLCFRASPDEDGL